LSSKKSTIDEKSPGTTLMSKTQFHDAAERGAERGPHDRADREDSLADAELFRRKRIAQYRLACRE
jgi:hypothetical protein